MGAGCGSGPTEDGGTGSPDTTGATTTAAGSSPGFSTWLPAPSALGGGGLYGVARIDVATIVENEEHVSSDVYERVSQNVENGIGPLEVGFEDFDWVLGFQGVGVYSGGFSSGPITDSLTANGYEQAGSYEGYAMYRNASAESATGVTDGTMILSRGGLDQLETVVDAKQGAIDRLGAAQPEFETALSYVDGGTVFSTRMPGSSGPVLQAYQVTIGGETSDVRFVLVHESASAYDEASMRGSLESIREDSGVNDASISFEGPVVVISIDAETATYASSTMRGMVT